jgi:hypothetical protein
MKTIKDSIPHAVDYVKKDVFPYAVLLLCIILLCITLYIILKGIL